jgi:hypothetical protein
VGTAPQILVSNVDELFTDHLGQRWSPATVRVSWPAAPGLRPPAVSIQVIASVRGGMTADQLRHAHIGAARDVLVAAMNSLADGDGKG